MEFIKRSLLQLNPYHLLQNSPWPFFESFSLLSLTLSAVLYMHGYPNAGYYLILGYVLTAYCMALWFRDVITESTYEGAHTKQVVNGLLIGFLLFIVSEAFVFLSVFWAYFHSALSPAVEIGGCWPPQGIKALNAFAIPLLNTILLLSSGAFVTLAHHALLQGDRKVAIKGTLITVLLAVIFTSFQGYEYYQAPFSITDSVFGSAFFASTGLHGLHVIIGTIFIAIGLFRIISYHFTTKHHLGYEASILYWHFVDIVWLFLFIAVYYWGGN
jgi:cytochrome c oxidase subunit 3